MPFDAIRIARPGAAIMGYQMADGIATDQSRRLVPLEPRSQVTTRRGWRRLLTSPWLVAVPVLLLYGIWIFAFYGPGRDPRDAILLGRHFVTMSHASAVIKYDPTYNYPAGEIGYDGEFVYFIALDPVNARHYVDTPSYRYSRIVLPLLARALALGQPALVPYVLLLINWLAIAAATLMLAMWLRRRSVSPWFALVYGFYPGLFICLQRDTTEALAYAFVVLAVFLWDYGGPRRILWSSLVFSVAVLTRESTAVFPVLYALSLLFVAPPTDRARGPARNAWLTAALVVAMAIGPLLIYKAFLLLWLGSHGDPGLLLERVPFLGLLRQRHSGSWVEEVRSVVFPALIGAGAAAVAVWRRARLLEPWVLLANVVFFVALLPESAYVDISASARVTAGVVLAATLCLPVLLPVLRSRTWFWVSATLWLSLVPFWLLRPELSWLIEVSRPLRHAL